ncbi:hypothetical protein RN001_001316 [Aquatica leii]|uniref:DNA-directed DNA polymerase n=1 Tax=Aquatica leii TaxID=1421715 RepID=A0AAN7SSL9_9COLE|nr:hypothetical protein RN001_001316 [Aquatica leii]
MSVTTLLNLFSCNVFSDNELLEVYNDICDRIVLHGDSLSKEDEELLLQLTDQALSKRILLNSISNPQPSTSRVTQSDNAFNEILNHLLVDASPSDRVGVVLRNDNFPERPIGISFRRRDQLNSKVIIATLEKILQSNINFFSTDALRLHLDRVSLPTGYVNNNYVFDFNNEIVKYCISDVNILRKACLEFWNRFTTSNGVDPFRESCTIAGACNSVFRRNYLTENSIGLIPPNGYRMADKQSTIAIKWLLWLEHTLDIKIEHAGNAREVKLKEGILVDGFCHATNTVYQFHGCYFHGCEICFPDQTAELSGDKQDTMFARREKTEATATRIRSFGYNLVEMKECKFRQFLKINIQALEFTASHAVIRNTPLNPRDSFFGGRTNAVKLYYKAEENEVCGETMFNGICNHTDDERKFTGTYVADELREALSQGYKVLEILEVWEYEIAQYNRSSRSGGLFTKYVNNFLKLKQESSGWPSWCTDDQAKERYVSEYLEREGIALDKSNISVNPGMRYIAKLCLNSFWGKFAQRENLMQSSIIQDPYDLFKMLTDPSVEAHSLTTVDDETIILNWDRPDEGIVPLKTVNVALAAYTTANARLELYKYLKQLGRRVLYFDTDSIIFTEKPGEWVPVTGDFLGDMTDEIECYGPGSKIVEFVSGGPKNYAFKVFSTNSNQHEYICKVKGITLNFKNSLVVNFETLKSMVLDQAEDTYVQTDRRICRNSTFDVLSRPERKVFRVNYTKRRRLEDSMDTLPYGYR